MLTKKVYIIGVSYIWHLLLARPLPQYCGLGASCQFLLNLDRLTQMRQRLEVTHERGQNSLATEVSHLVSLISEASLRRSWHEKYLHGVNDKIARTDLKATGLPMFVSFPEEKDHANPCLIAIALSSKSSKVMGRSTAYFQNSRGAMVYTTSRQSH